MISKSKIKSLGNGVFEVPYTTKDGDSASFTFSKETLCYINCDRNELLVCVNDDQKIDTQYIVNMSPVDYVVFGSILMNNPEYGMSDLLIHMTVEKYDPTPDNEFHTIFGENWYINPDLVSYVNVGDCLCNYKYTGTYLKSKMGTVKFKSLFGHVMMNEVDGNALYRALENRWVEHNNTIND